MAVTIPSKFTKFILNENEELQASKLPPLTIMYLHNMRCMVAETIINLEPDPNKIMDFIKQKAYLDAKFNLLNELINDDMIQPQPEGAQ